MAKGGGGQTTTVKQDIPEVFKPAFTSLFNSAFGAARTSAGQDLSARANTFYPQNPYANMITGGAPLNFGQPQQQQGGWPGAVGGGMPLVNRQNLYGSAGLSPWGQPPPQQDQKGGQAQQPQQPQASMAGGGMAGGMAGPGAQPAPADQKAPGGGAGGQLPGGVPGFAPGMQAQPGQMGIGSFEQQQFAERDAQQRQQFLAQNPGGLTPANMPTGPGQADQKAPGGAPAAGQAQPQPLDPTQPQQGLQMNPDAWAELTGKTPQGSYQASIDARRPEGGWPGGTQGPTQAPGVDSKSPGVLNLAGGTPADGGMTLMGGAGQQGTTLAGGAQTPQTMGAGFQGRRGPTGGQAGAGGVAPGQLPPELNVGGSQFTTNPQTGAVDLNVPQFPPAGDSKRGQQQTAGTNTFGPSSRPGILGLSGDNKSGGGAQFSGLPGGFTAPGSTSVPLASGEPIIGQPFPGPFTAPTSPLELEALQGREGVARQMMGAGGSLFDLGQAQAAGSFLDPSTNPFFTQNIEASLQPAIDAFTRSTMPQFASQALQSGAFKGSSAREFAAGNLASDFGRNLSQTAAQEGMQNYMRERQIQQQTPQLIDAAARLQQLGPEILSQVGLGEREVIQRMMDEALLMFQEQQQAPFRPLGPLANIIQGTNVGLNTTSTVPGPSALGQGIAGALGGAGMGAGIANAMDWGGMGGGASVGLGSLLGLLGGLA